MKLLNTLSGEKEILEKPKHGSIRMFVCGPTVFDYSHIGHARTYVVFDILARYLRNKKWKVYYLQNITDVDDKIIDRARTHNTDPLLYAHKFEQFYKRDMKAIGVTGVTKYARASAHIRDITKQIQTLIQKGHAYEIPENGYYFDIKTFADYGKLSHRTAEQAEDAITRIDEGINKKNRGDFALWKFVSVPEKYSKKKYAVINGEPAWNTSLGWGRPGWHIEDTAITEHYFGPQYDIHGGGGDLKFPHHEAEIAQQESASGKKPFVRFWLHTGFLRIQGEKMSKSLGNFITIESLLTKMSANELRWFFASHHYRSPIQWDEEFIEQSRRSFSSILDTYMTLQFVSKKGKQINEISKENIIQWITTCTTTFTNAMEDDLNTPEACAALFIYANSIKPNIWKLTKTQARAAQKPLEYAFSVFGISVPHTKIPNKIAALATQRELYRRNKQFAPSDDLRKTLDGLGYTVDDTPLGPFVRVKS